MAVVIEVVVKWEVETRKVEKFVWVREEGVLVVETKSVSTNEVEVVS